MAARQIFDHETLLRSRHAPYRDSAVNLRDSPGISRDRGAVMNASFLAEKFAAALPYDHYVLTGTEEQKRRWQQVYDAARLTDAQRQLVGGFVREMKVLILSGIWC